MPAQRDAAERVLGVPGGVTDTRRPGPGPAPWEHGTSGGAACSGFTLLFSPLLETPLGDVSPEPHCVWCPRSPPAAALCARTPLGWRPPRFWEQRPRAGRARLGGRALSCVWRSQRAALLLGQPAPAPPVHPAGTGAGGGLGLGRGPGRARGSCHGLGSARFLTAGDAACPGLTARRL